MKVLAYALIAVSIGSVVLDPIREEGRVDDTSEGSIKTEQEERGIDADEPSQESDFNFEVDVEKIDIPCLMKLAGEIMECFKKGTIGKLSCLLGVLAKTSSCFQSFDVQELENFFTEYVNEWFEVPALPIG